jgi:hypothetical protein
MRFAADILSALAPYKLRGRNAGFYEIPITPVTFAPRKHMSAVADNRRLRGAEKTRRTSIRREVAVRKMAPADDRREHPMMDLIVIIIALGFFALSVGYTIACDRL